MINLRPAHYADIAYVARHMRALDRRELFAFDATENPEKLARDLTWYEQFHWGAFIDWQPVTIISAVEKAPTLWHVGMFSTDAWPKVALNCTLFYKQVIYPTLEKLGCNRAECRSYIAHKAAHRWLQIIGAKRECIIHDVGLRRDSYVQFAWTRKDLERQKKN